MSLGHLPFRRGPQQPDDFVFAYGTKAEKAVRQREIERRSASREFGKVEANEPVYPVMDGYLMKCCDCDLVHTFDFRAVKITERFANGEWAYAELDPNEYRVMLMADRVTGMRWWVRIRLALLRSLGK